jgi:hypothetical protein
MLASNAQSSRISLAAKSCHWTSPAPHGFVRAMNDDTKLVRQLCTRIGCLMEDASVVALVWDDDFSLKTRVQTLEKASANIQALVAAATALMTKEADL